MKRIAIKPASADLLLICRMDTQSFTGFLHLHPLLRRETAPGSPELYVADAVNAAVDATFDVHGIQVSPKPRIDIGAR